VSARRIPEIPRDGLTLGPGAATWFRAFLALGVAGLAGAFALAAWTEDGWRRFHPSYLASFVFFLSLALGALFFVALLLRRR